MKEKIFELLKAKLGKTSLSERTLSSKAEQLAKRVTKEEDITDEFIAFAVDDLQVIEGQLRKDVADLVKKALDGSKPNPNPNPVPTPTPEPKAEPENEMVKLLKEQMEKLQASVNELSQERKIAEQKVQRDNLYKGVISALEKEGCNQKLFVELVSSQIDYEKSLEDNTTTLKQLYETKLNDYVKNGGYVPQQTMILNNPLVKEEDIKKSVQEDLQRLKENGLLKI